MADALVVDVYRLTRQLPADERFGLTAQLRRAAVSVPTNIVEGSARRTAGDYSNFIGVALGSASETVYLLQLASRLALLPAKDTKPLADGYDRVSRALSGLLAHLDRSSNTRAPGSDEKVPIRLSQSPKSKVQSPE